MKPTTATSRVVIRIKENRDIGGWYLEFQEWLWKDNRWTNTAGNKDGNFFSIKLWTYPDLESQVDEIKGVISRIRNTHRDHEIVFPPGSGEQALLEKSGITFREFGGEL